MKTNEGDNVICKIMENSNFESSHVHYLIKQQNLKLNKIPVKNSAHLANIKHVNKIKNKIKIK